MDDKPESSHGRSLEDIYTTEVAGSSRPSASFGRPRKFLPDPDGWLAPKMGGRWLERLQFKFSEGKDEVPSWVESFERTTSGSDESHHDDEASELPFLVGLLSAATSLKVAVHVGEKVALAKALKLTEDPVPRLENLEIQCFVGQKVIDSVLDAMMSDKFRRLKSLKWEEHNSHEAQEAYLGKLARVFRGGMLPLVSSIDLSFDHYDTSKGIEHLANSLRGAKSLRHLRIDKKEMGTGHSTLSDVIQSGDLGGLQTLSLVRTGVNDGHCQDYERAFSSGGVEAMEELKLALNDIYDDGAAALARAFSSDKLRSLTHLDLSKNFIADDGMDALAGGLRSLPNLKNLCLESNTFTSRGLVALCGTLASGRLNRLESLDLKLNRQSSTQEGAQALVDAYSTNIQLLANVGFEWEKFPQLEMQKEQLLKRNRRHVKLLASLPSILVLGTFARVNICGNQRVGKTTLQKSLRRSRWKSLARIERWPRQEMQTRGIAVSQVVSSSGPGSLNLVLWDMAGQDDFHLVHNAFLPDSTTAQGRAEIFVIVCKSANLYVARSELEYWLRFIASSSGISIQNPRNVLFVINRFKGDSAVLSHEQEWGSLLQEHKTRFEEYLVLHTSPFILDARRRKSVLPLKQFLMNESRRLLADSQVPEICQSMQSQLRVWSEEKKHFPVLSWQELVSRVQGGLGWQSNEDTIDAAAKYLHSAGVVLYISKEPSDPPDGAHSLKLLVLDPNWFLRAVVGNVFLPPRMARTTEPSIGYYQNSSDGSISISQLKDFLETATSLVPHFRRFEDAEFQDLVEILLTLGLCYKGQRENLFIPALIPSEPYSDSGSREDCWGHNSPLQNHPGQWVMGFSVVHQQNDRTLAPISLWHKFQVALANVEEYRGRLDSDFLVRRYSVTFKYNFMAVLIQVNPSGGRPTFDGVDIFVKPFLHDDNIQDFDRKLYQVDLASKIAEILLNLWNQVCPGVAYVERVVWPWPASWNSRPDSEDQKKRNVEVAELKKLVNEHGLDKMMQWTVGSDVIKEGQLLSTRDKQNVLRSVEAGYHFLEVEVQQAVKLGIFPEEILNPVNRPARERDEEVGRSNRISDVDPTGFQTPDAEKLHRTMTQQHEEVMQKLDGLTVLAQENLKLNREIMTMNKSRIALQRKVLEVGEMMFEDREHEYPRYIFLLKRNHTSLATLRDAISPTEKVHLQFACEARYNDSAQHAVPNQQGVDLSGFRTWARKLAPCLQVSMTVLLISARVAAHLIAPGLGSVFPAFIQWQQASSVSEGVALATGYSRHELEQLLKAESIHGGAREQYIYSKREMGAFLAKLGSRDLEEKLLLSKARLCNEDGSFHKVAWICRDCHRKYSEQNRIRD